MGKQKHSYEYICNYFTEQGCELLEEVYINNSTRMKFKCSCGNISYITFSNFQQGQRCKKCSGSDKYTHEYIKQYFQDNGCELLSKSYHNNKEKLQYKCSCGNISYISFSSFKQGHRCGNCNGGIKFTYQYVSDYFDEFGCKLLENDYINAQTKMKFMCNCGEMGYISFACFRKGYRCKKCSGKHKAEAFKFSYQYVYDYFELMGCKLLEKEYINANTPMKYQCECGNISTIRFSSFQQGSRCDQCSGSRGEKRISRYLINNNIKFKSEYKFNDCRNKRPLPFDFAIFDDNNQLQFLIEYDGILHYEPKISIEEYKKLKTNDNKKTKYCKINNIPLLRIPYTDFKNIESILGSYFIALKIIKYNKNKKCNTKGGEK